jgi:hypothetical protein
VAARVKRSEARKVVVGVECDRDELKVWGRAAQLQRQQLPEWIRRSLCAAAEADEQRNCPKPVVRD